MESIDYTDVLTEIKDRIQDKLNIAGFRHAHIADLEENPLEHKVNGTHGDVLVFYDTSSFEPLLAENSTALLEIESPIYSLFVYAQDTKNKNNTFTMVSRVSDAINNLRLDNQQVLHRNSVKLIGECVSGQFVYEIQFTGTDISNGFGALAPADFVAASQTVTTITFTWVDPVFADSIKFTINGTVNDIALGVQTFTATGLTASTVYESIVKGFSDEIGSGTPSIINASTD